MYFRLIDAVVELSAERVVAIKLVSSAEEYLQDHFPGYPVLPGVFMLEAMVQAAKCIESQTDPDEQRLTLGTVRALKYGSFVRPGQMLRATVDRTGPLEYKGRCEVVDPMGLVESRLAASGRFTLRAPIPVGVGPGGAFA